MDNLVAGALDKIVEDIGDSLSHITFAELRHFVNSSDIELVRMWVGDSFLSANIQVCRNWSAEEMLANLADKIQDVVIDELWSAWPGCPMHPNAHPAQARWQETDPYAWWVCPLDGRKIARIGDLNDAPHVAR